MHSVSRSDADDDDRVHMRRALSLAQRGWGRVHPNPLVGAVLVQRGRIVGEGWHAEYGGPHAEVAAIAAAGSAARGATLYVTLEPCSHQGKTPPCTEAIARAGIARVVYGATDPDPSARGGAAALARYGIQVRGGLDANAARAIDPGFFHVRERGTCWVALKLAVSLDGRIAGQGGQPARVTGDAARAEVHRLRAGFEAILVGSTTARIDDPALTVRGPVQPRIAPTRIVIDTSATLPPESQLVRTARKVPVIVITGDDAPAARVAALEEAGACVLPVARSADGIAIADALAALRTAGFRTILCEGGGRLAASLLEAGLVHRLHLFCAPRFFGSDGTPAFPLREPPPGAWRFRGARAVGMDLMVTIDRTAEES